MVKDVVLCQAADPAKRVVANVAGHLRAAFIFFDQSITFGTVSHLVIILWIDPLIKVVKFVATLVLPMVRLPAFPAHCVLAIGALEQPLFALYFW